MIVRSLKTQKITAGSRTIYEILDSSLPQLKEKSILVITSKIIALCQGRVVSIDGKPKDELIRQEADFVLPEELTDEYIQLTITNNTLIPASGIDQSNSEGNYVLWPQDVQKTANEIRAHLKKRFDLNEVGIMITDSSAMPLRFGTMGIPIAYSGFSPFKNYTGQKDLFGYPLQAGRANLAGGLAAAAVVVMGEGAEQTPLAIVSDVEFIEFKDADPDKEELEKFFVPHNKDRMFAPFFKGIAWQPGGRRSGGNKS